MGIFGNRSKKRVIISTKPKPVSVNQPTKIYTLGINFKRYNVVYDGSLGKGEEVTLRWLYGGEMQRNDIVEIRPGCQCTANISWDDEGVTAVFTNKEKDKDLSSVPTVITKSMRVYYNDGIGKIPNGKNGMAWAPEKFSEVLQFSGHVKK